MPDERDSNPLLKENPTHLFRFEEKIFGMTLPHLLSDIGGILLITSITTGLPLVPRIIVGVVAGLLILVLVHARVQGYTMLVWLYLLARFSLIAKKTVWRPSTQPRQKGEPLSIQETWVHLSTLSQGIMGQSVARKRQEEPDVSYWVAFAVENVQSVRFLPEAEQVRFYGRLKTFLDGLGFPIKFISLVESSDPQSDPSLLAQHEAQASLSASPHLHKVLQASLAVQRQQMQYCTTRQHYLIVAASSQDVAATRVTDTFRSPLGTLLSLLSTRKRRPVTRTQVREHLHVRISIVKKALASLDVRASLLNDTECLRMFSASFALGAPLPSFEIEVEEDRPGRSVEKPSVHTTDTPDEGGKRPLLTPAQTPAEKMRWKKRVRALHRTFLYTSKNARKTFEDDPLMLCDLVAPSSVSIGRDAVAITIGGEVRYQRYFEVLGFGSDLLCGWQEELTSLGLPMILMTRCEPLDSRAMVKKLQFHLTKLESSHIADQKKKRLPDADQQIENEQVRTIIQALAGKKLKIFAVQMVIGIHAGTRTRLEQRTDYLLSHLRDLQLTVRTLSMRHDVAWQTCLASSIESTLDHYTNLPSDVLSTFINWSTGAVGTPTGAYLGTTGTGLSKRLVRINPWDAIKRLPNPHMTICGDSGMGKSWIVKLIILGLLASQIADAVVMDRDGDYNAMHEFLGNGESQRFNLAGVIPINLLDIPYGPADVDLQEKTDLLAEFLDNHLLVGLALLYGEALSKPQEAFLTAAARAAYSTRGISIEAIWRDPDTLLLEPPTFSDLLASMKTINAANESVRSTLLERFENVAYLFPGQTSVKIGTPLTIFNIHSLDEKWYPLMVYVVQTFLMRHRALKRDERYLAYVIEEASYLLRHPAGKRYLEQGSRGFRKLGIAQFVVSQHPADFLEEGQVILANSATNIFLGMQRTTAQKLGLAEELERVLEEAAPGRAVIRCGREYAQLDITAGSALLRAILTTDPVEQRTMRKKHQEP